MHKVFFNGIEVFNSDSIEDAIALALMLHRSSNVEHKVEVLEAEKEKASITLVRALKKD